MNKHRRKDVSKQIFLNRLKKDATFGELGIFMREYSPYRLEILQRLVLAERPLKFYELYRGDPYEKNRLKKHIPTLSKAKLVFTQKINGINFISLTSNGLLVYLSSLNSLINEFLDRESEQLISIFYPRLDESELKLVNRIQKIVERERSKMRYRKHKETINVLEYLLVSLLEIDSELRVLKILSKAVREDIVDGLTLVALADHVVKHHGHLLPKDLVNGWNTLKGRDNLGLRAIFLIRAAYNLPYYAAKPEVISEKSLQEHLENRFMTLFTFENMLIERQRFMSHTRIIPREPELQRWASFLTIYSCLGCEWLYLILPSRNLSKYVLHAIKDFREDLWHQYAVYHHALLFLARHIKPKGLKKLGLAHVLLAQLPKSSREVMEDLVKEVLEVVEARIKL